MYGLADLLISRIKELTQDLRFEHKATGTTKAPEVINAFLPPKASSWQEGQDHPCVRVAVYRGAFDIRPQPTHAVVIGGIWTSGDVVAGTADIKTLAMALGRIVENRSFPPFRLVTPVEYHFGDQQPGHEGLQPHPYHYVILHLKLILP